MDSALRRIAGSACALVGLVLISPLLLAIAVAIKLEDGGPVFFYQQRVGRYGKLFTIIKFRSLQVRPHDVHHLHAYTTRFGGFLRRYGLDELPQLWHIVQGEMSLVGPRPILPEEVTHYDSWQAQRLDVSPGLTGWAQVNGRNRLMWYERVALDVWYVEHRTLWLDLWILVRTVVVVVHGEGVYGAGNVDPGVAERLVYQAQVAHVKDVV